MIPPSRAVRTLRVLLPALSLALLAGAQNAGAQDGYFTFPDKSPDYRSYKTLSQCLAATRRVRTREQNAQPFADTLPYDPPREVSPAIAATARDCARPLLTQPVVDDELYALVELADAMRDDTLALAAVRRRAALTGSTAEKAKLLANAVGQFMNPNDTVRPSLAHAITADLDAMGDDLIAERVKVHWALMWGSWVTLDTALATEAASLLSTIRSVPEKARRDFVFNGMFALWVQNAQTFQEYGIDSATAKFRADLDSLIGPEVIASLPFFSLLGKPAPPVTGDFWFGRAPGDSIYPRKGHVTVIEFTDANLCFTNCRPAFAVLRRWKQRFGDELDVVIADRTHGYLRDMLLTDPRAEAEALRDYYLGFERVPGVVAVSSTPFTRRPDPDRRRVEGKVPNDSTYGIAEAIVDQRGKVVMVLPLSFTWPTQEAVFGQFLELLISRGESAASSAGSTRH